MNSSKKKSIYRAFASDCPELPIFFQPWYLDATSVSGVWEVALSLDKNGKVRGVFPYFIKTKAGIRHITLPHLTPYLGPYLVPPEDHLKNTSLYRYEKNVMLDLAEQIPDVALHKTHCHPDLKNILPFTWKGYEAQVRYTFVLDKKDEVKLWEELDSKQRNIIKGAKDKLQVIEVDDIEGFYRLNKKSFDRKGDQISYSSEFLGRLDEALLRKNCRMLLNAIDEQGRVYAGIYIVFDQRSAYCLCIGSEPDLIASGAVPLLIWEAILKSFQRVDRFNFEGGMMPNIERAFRSYGGRLVPYYKLQKSFSRLTLSLLMLLNKV